MIRLRIPQQVCQLCGRRPQIGINRPKSLHKTKRIVLPNLQKVRLGNDKRQVLVCAKCLKTLFRQN